MWDRCWTDDDRFYHVFPTTVDLLRAKVKGTFSLMKTTLLFGQQFPQYTLVLWRGGLHATKNCVMLVCLVKYSAQLQRCSNFGGVMQNDLFLNLYVPTWQSHACWEKMS